MPKRSEIERRKKPSQQRSKDTVRLILDAAKTILVKKGVSSFTTNRIAELSGFTVGSIYQYFPNKEAVIYEVYKEWLDASLEDYEMFAEKHKDLTDPLDYFSTCFLSVLDDILSEDDGLAFELNIAFYTNQTLRQLDAEFDKQLINRIKKDAIRLGAISRSKSDSLRLKFYFKMAVSLADVVAQAEPADREQYRRFVTELIGRLSRD